MPIRIPTLALALAAAAMPALADNDTTVLDRVDRELADARADQAAQAAAARGQPALTWGGEASLSYVSSDRPRGVDYAAGRANLELFGIWADQDRQMLFVRLRGLHDDGFGKNVFLGNQNQPSDEHNQVWFDRFWYGISLAKTMGSEAQAWDVRAQVGLQQVKWGSGLVLDNALYAGLVDAGGELSEESGELWLTGMAGYTPDRDFYEFDRSRPDYHREVNRLFAGGQLAWQDTGPLHSKIYGYWLTQRDHNDSEGATPLGLPAVLTPMPANYRYDSHYFGLGAAGKVPGLPQLSYTVEGVLERGRSSSSPMNAVAAAVPQTRENIDAWAAQALLAWSFRDVQTTKLEAEMLLGSGDSDRFGSSSGTLGGNTSGTGDKAFNAFGFARTGLLYNAPLSNLASMRLGLSTFVIPKQLQLGADAYLFRKIDRRGASHETTRAGSDLGFETDFRADWRALSDVTLTAGYGFFVPGEAAASHQVRHFIFTGVRYAF